MLHKILPRGYINWVRDKLIHAGMKTVPEKYVDRAVIISVVMAVVFGLFSIEFLPIISLCVFTFMFFLMNGWLILAVEKRKNFVEKVLPDALELMAANIKSGFIPFILTRKH